MGDLRKSTFERAASYGGKLLLPRRIGLPIRPLIDTPTELDREYEACEALVVSGHARWMQGRPGPGIYLTGKPIDVD